MGNVKTKIKETVIQHGDAIVCGVIAAVACAVGYKYGVRQERATIACSVQRMWDRNPNLKVEMWRTVGELMAEN